MLGSGDGEAAEASQRSYWRGQRMCRSLGRCEPATDVLVELPIVFGLSCSPAKAASRIDMAQRHDRLSPATLQMMIEQTPPS